MSKKKKKNKAARQPAVDNEYEVRLKAMQDEWAKEDEERKQRLAKKMPGEFKPDYICVDGQFCGMPKEIEELDKLNLPDKERWKREREIMDKVEQEAENQRHWFALYYSEGGDSYPFAEFKGEILKLEQDRILFKRIWMVYDLDDYECTTREGTEDHVWIYDCEPFKKLGVKVGTCCKFNACAYAYKRANSTVDFGLKCPENIEIIDRYELPDMKKVSIRDGIRGVQQLVCETCMFTEQCYEKGSPVCVAADGYRETQELKLFYASKDNYDAVIKILHKNVSLPDKAFLGIYTMPAEEGKPGLIVIGCPRESKLHLDDVILEINGVPIHEYNDLAKSVADNKPGDSVTIKRSALGVSEPDEIKHTLINRDQMYDMLLWTTPLDTIADMAGKAAHKPMKESA